jgi:hypothetical protein
MNVWSRSTDERSHFEGEVGFDLTLTGEPLEPELKFSFSAARREYLGGV